MMGPREKLVGGDEWDSFSRYYRRCHRPTTGVIRRIKAKFWRRIRKLRRLELKFTGE